MYTYILLAPGRRQRSNGAKPYVMRVCSVLPYTQFLDFVSLVTPSHLPTALFANAARVGATLPSGGRRPSPPTPHFSGCLNGGFWGVTSGAFGSPRPVVNQARNNGGALRPIALRCLWLKLALHVRSRLAPRLHYFNQCIMSESCDF